MIAAAAKDIDQATRIERQRAMRALLQSPLLSAAGPNAAEFGLIRRHRQWISEWLSRFPGWRLQVEAEFARLRKTPGDLDDSTRPAREPKEEIPFTRRRYALLCLAMAALERSDRQTTLGRLAEDMQGLISSHSGMEAAGLALDLLNYDHRRDLVHVVRFLASHRILVPVHGDEQQFLNRTGDALYNIERSSLAVMLNIKRGPSTIETRSIQDRIDKIVEEPLPDNDDGRNRRMRTTIVRRLLEDPVLYYEDLDADSAAYFQRQRGLLLSQIEEATGLHAEVRKEGVAMVDSEGDLTDLAMPEAGTLGHLTLLVAEYLAAHARQSPGEPLSITNVVRRTAELIGQHRSRWNKEASLPNAEIPMTSQALDRLEALRLVKRLPHNTVLPLATIGRYALGETLDATPSET